MRARADGDVANRRVAGLAEHNRPFAVWLRKALDPKEMTVVNTIVGADDELPPRLLDITTLAQLLGVNTRHVRRLVAERRIPFIKWGHLLRFDPVEVKLWIDAYRRRPDRSA